MTNGDAAGTPAVIHQAGREGTEYPKAVVQYLSGPGARDGGGDLPHAADVYKQTARISRPPVPVHPATSVAF